MSKSDQDQKIESLLLQDGFESLAKALNECQTQEEIKAFLFDLCTPKEIEAFKERWLVAQLLHETSLSYRDINTLTGISTTTIGRVARFLHQEPHQGYKSILDKAS